VQTSASDEPKEPELTVEEHHRQLTDELEERFQREPADRQWNAEATHKIKRSVTANAPSTRVLEASCATTMCKVVVSHDSLTAQRELGAKLALEEPFRSGVYYDYDHESNPPTTTLYVMRD
jgi:hypothetical protein